MMTASLILVSMIGTFQNLMVIAALLFSRNNLLQIPSNWFVLSLATADFLVCGVSVPLYIAHLHVFIWQHFLAFGHFTTIISAGSLFLLTFNRFLSIYDTLSYMKRMTVFRAKSLAMGMWCAAISLAIINTVTKNYVEKVAVFLSIAYYLMINILTAGFHVYMFRISWNKTKAIRGQRLAVMSGQQKNVMQEYNHLLRLAIIAGTYVITWVPFILTLSATPDDEERRSRTFQRKFALFYTLLSINSAIDPFLYFLRSEEFKKATKKILRIRSRTQNRVRPQMNAFHINRAF
ncbi:cannabinoid receptor 1-like [Dendronephthya gigantea]|uniref:cannabinoid receptor 1-like n=1 Tax=Dendronephthya gigantea TaxID=151771 RepID=UPI00106DC2A3|nr:cannabinoid receptor 1-like [Dendronephthya gigantea]